MYSTEQIREKIDIKALAYTLSLLSTTEGKQVDGPCPKCGGVDRMAVMVDRWHCRTCRPWQKGKKNDCFDFAIHVGLAHDFVSARQWLSDYLDGKHANITPVIATEAQGTQSARMIDHTGGYWQSNADKAIQAGIANRAQGIEYLLNRGLTRETVDAWDLGYGMGWSTADKAERPAIVIPWYSGIVRRGGLGAIDGIQYRFLTPDKANKRYGRFMFPHDKQTGSTGKMALYRLIDRHSDTLAIVEGEFNALSIWQALGCNVVSIGSEDYAHAAILELQRVIGRYTTVIVWADKAETVQDLSAKLGIGDAIQLVSPIEDGKKFDANEMLRSGVLSDFLAACIPQPLAGERVEAQEAATETQAPTTETQPLAGERVEAQEAATETRKCDWCWQITETEFTDGKHFCPKCKRKHIQAEMDWLRGKTPQDIAA